MSRHNSGRTQFGALSAVLCAALVGGCATWQGPRIDPSGERLFLWPNQPAPAVMGPPPAAPFVGVPFVPPPVAVPAPQFGSNIEAPPVYSDPPALPLAPPPVVVPAVPAAPVQPLMPAPMLPNPTVPVAVTPTAAAIPIGQDHLRVTPNSVVAPVGSHVVLKAGVCAADGYLRTDRRVEWQLARNGAGQFANLGDGGLLDVFRWNWDTPQMIDPWHAIGMTGYDRVVLQRGNLDPRDDVVVEAGEAWISVTSVCEGTSHVLAYTPDVASQFRSAVATIDWIDAQWVFPPSTAVPPGTPHVLTTCVARRTDGVPLAGWIVRYEVTGGGASLGYEAGSSIEVPTDPTGRASVEVSPAGGESGVANVMMTLIRPPLASAVAGRPLEIARGVATITWGIPAGAPAIAPFPAVQAPISGAPPSELAPALPPGTPYAREPAPFPAPAPDAYTPPSDEPPATVAPAQLDVTVSRDGPEEVEINQFVRFDVTVTNRGEGTARGILVKAQFDRGLAHPEAKPDEYEVEYRSMRDIPPGQSETVPLTFQVLAVGRQCARVTVTADGGATGFNQGCVTGRAAPPAAEPVLSVRKIGPTRQIVGDQAKFNIIVRNTGTVPVTNIEVVDKYDPALKPTITTSDHQRGADGSIIWKIASLSVGEKREIPVTCECIAPSGSACNNLIVTADGGISQADQVCVEILAPLPQEGAGRTVPPAVQQAALRPLIAVTTNPVNEGAQTTILVTVENTQQQAQPQVRLRVALPPEVTPDSSQIEPRGEFVVIGQEVRFNPMDFAPGRTEFEIPVTANQSGQVRIRARLEGDSLPQAIDVSSSVIEILPESL